MIAHLPVLRTGRFSKALPGDLSQPGCQLTRAVKRRKGRFRGRTGWVRAQPLWFRAYPRARVFETEKRARTKVPAKCLTCGRMCAHPLLSTRPTPESSWKGGWLRGMDSNHDSRLQGPMGCHWTTGEGGEMLTTPSTASPPGPSCRIRCVRRRCPARFG